MERPYKRMLLTWEDVEPEDRRRLLANDPVIPPAVLQVIQTTTPKILMSLAASGSRLHAVLAANDMTWKTMFKRDFPLEYMYFDQELPLQGVEFTWKIFYIRVRSYYRKLGTPREIVEHHMHRTLFIRQNMLELGSFDWRLREIVRSMLDPWRDPVALKSLMANPELFVRIPKEDRTLEAVLLSGRYRPNKDWFKQGETIAPLLAVWVLLASRYSPPQAAAKRLEGGARALKSVLYFLKTGGAVAYRTMLNLHPLAKRIRLPSLDVFHGWRVVFHNDLWIFGPMYHPLTLEKARDRLFQIFHDRLHDEDPWLGGFGSNIFLNAAIRMIRELETLPRGKDDKILIEQKFYI